ncbi:MAG: heavy-metal-associated domain-containing protein [Sphingobacteriales bacterium]|jgi:mercuric ion binding protein|nr:heavy-metal-associated domain-containing protein [Sphingobacteriales bacterium]
MKNAPLVILTIFCTFLSVNTFAKEDLTKTSFKVWGNCDMCKKRIEKAAKADGVKSAVWNEENGIVTISFAPAKISVDKIQQNIANSGYDTEKYKASDSAYHQLPQCCQYER